MRRVRICGDLFVDEFHFLKLANSFSLLAEKEAEQNLANIALFCWNDHDFHPSVEAFQLRESSVGNLDHSVHRMQSTGFASRPS